jgi:hypothetical protein
MSLKAATMARDHPPAHEFCPCQVARRTEESASSVGAASLCRLAPDADVHAKTHDLGSRPSSMWISLRIGERRLTVPDDPCESPCSGPGYQDWSRFGQAGPPSSGKPERPE